MPKWKPLKGMKFGKLTVLEDFRSEERHYHMCKCICDCGNSCVKRACELTSKGLHTCPVCGKERTIKSKIKHGMSHTKFFERWLVIKRRCYDKNFRHYKNYGGRGIQVCDRWKDSFENFKDDMHKSYLDHVAKYGEKNTFIDRINVNGNYSPENCRWATRHVQNLNKRTTRYYTFEGKQYNIYELTEKFNATDRELLRGRLKNNKYNVDYVYKRWYVNEQVD